ncbi:glutathione s-transferase u17 [Phtheirospermum japonicum]|uniref:glutathione transferase n=1 Tax=Phtheirospermum japonicum TaxID=374723 RepID=A0A830BYD8_9LAMI|nr:glutathione s-transferase u17 [Phtheirospermum japonicum]
MAKSSVKVLGAWASPFVQKVEIALNLKSIEYEFIQEDLGNKSQLLLESNPVHKKIPVLIHDGKPVCESLIIVQYIDDVWTKNGPSFLPSDPYDRATARFWAAYIDDKWLPLLSSLANGEEAEKTVIPLEEAHQVLAVLENAFIKCSKGQKFFGGDKIGYVDIEFGSCLGWIKIIEKMGNLSLISESTTPNLVKWAQDFCAVDAVKVVLPETDKLMEYAKSYAAKAVKKN